MPLLWQPVAGGGAVGPAAQTRAGEEASLRSICSALSREQLQGEQLTSGIPGRSGRLCDAAAGKKLRWTLPAVLPPAPCLGAHL